MIPGDGLHQELRARQNASGAAGDGFHQELRAGQNASSRATSASTMVEPTPAEPSQELLQAWPEDDDDGDD